MPRSLKYCIHGEMLTLGSQHARDAKKPSLSGKSVCVCLCIHMHIKGFIAILQLRKLKYRQN